MCPVKMNAETAAWSRHYRTALRRYLRSGTSANPPSALRLGRRAATLGIETLDVVRIHEQAVATLTSPDGASGNLPKKMDRANAFFAEAIVPIEKTHRAAMKADVREKRATRALRLRTQEALTSRRQLKRGVVRRQAAEAALQKSGKRRDKLLTEARCLQKRLRHLTREILEAQEDERRKTSCQLHDEVAQALLAINLRMLTLKMAAKVNTRNLKKEIAETQRLVKASTQTIRGFSHEYEGDHEA